MHLFKSKDHIQNKVYTQNTDFLVIGAGRFGSAVAKTLHQLEKEVLLMDKNEERLQTISDEVTHTVIADAMDEKSLKALEAENFDVAIVAIGSDLNASILITLLLKEIGVKTIICKAVTELQAKTLYKLGASSVIFPERDTGVRVAHNLVSTTILDSIDIDPKFSLIETIVPKPWIDQSIIELDIRNKYNLNLLAIKRNDNVDVTPNPDQILKEGDIIILLGERDTLLNIESH